MSALRILFVCSRNQWRSPTAEKVWSREPNVMVRSAGTSPNARRTITASDLQWADLVLVMEQKHKDRVRAQFGRAAQFANIQVLDIPDDYQFMDPELIEIVQDAVLPFIP